MTGSNFYSHKRGPGTHFSLQLNDGELAERATFPIRHRPRGAWVPMWDMGKVTAGQVLKARPLASPGQPQRAALCHEWVLGCTSTRLSDRLPQLLVNFSVCYM